MQRAMPAQAPPQGLHLLDDQRPGHAFLDDIAPSQPGGQLPEAMDGREFALGVDRLEPLQGADHPLLDDERQAGGKVRRRGQLLELPVVFDQMQARARRAGGRLDETGPIGLEQDLARPKQLLRRADHAGGRLRQARRGQGGRQRILGLERLKRLERRHRHRRAGRRPGRIAAAQRGKEVGLLMDGQKDIKTLAGAELGDRPHVAGRIGARHRHDVDAVHPLRVAAETPGLRGAKLDRPPGAPKDRDRLPGRETQALGEQDF